MKHKMTLNEKSIYEAIGELNSGNCEPVANDKGEVFTSIVDAAKHANVTPQYMWSHLQPNGPRTCKGHVYFYIKKRDESFGRVMNRLSEVSAEVERRKADEEDARKWREYQAEQEAIRKAEEKRIEDERKAKEKREADLEKAKNRVERRRRILERSKEQTAQAEKRLIEAEIELEALLDNNQQEVA